MEADWEFEIGPGAPIIDAVWSGFLDLRLHPHCVSEVSETAHLPGLADALLRLNAPVSFVFTSKCDVWTPEEFDSDELDALPAEAQHAVACYIDLLPRVKLADASAMLVRLETRMPDIALQLLDSEVWETTDAGSTIPQTALSSTEKSVRNCCAALRATPLRNCRADLVMRRACVTPVLESLGITVYLTACGTTRTAAKKTLGAALAAFTSVITPQTPASYTKPQSKIEITGE